MREKSTMDHPPLSKGEELANALSHGVGIGLSIAAVVLLAVFASINGTARHIVSFSIYGATLVLLYTASTLYHSFRNPRIRRVLRVCDHAAIYLLIAGTYTPFTLVVFEGAFGWVLFGIIWGLAATGVVLKLAFVGRFHKVAVGLYIAMGWLVVIGMKPLIHGLAPGGLALLVIGGVLYTGGTVFYACKRIPWNHAIWHLFVLGGSVCQFFAVLFYTLPWEKH
jgi:hemolysin III